MNPDQLQDLQEYRSIERIHLAEVQGRYMLE
jgi:hypothetical protein